MMTLQEKLKALFAEVLAEAGRNPEFLERLSHLLEDRPPSAATSLGGAIGVDPASSILWQSDVTRHMNWYRVSKP